MAAPAAIVAYVPPLDFADIPATVPLDGSASTSGIANPALTYLWELKTKPPGSAAALSATNTATVNLLNVDTAGTYIVWLRVQNADGVWSEQVFETTPNTEPASRVYVNVKTQNLGLIPTGLWARTMQDLSAGDPGFNDEQQKTIDLFNAVDDLGGIAPSGAQQATRYVTAAAGPSTATGTISDPFNATSAAANGFDGPWNQAQNSLETGATTAALGYSIIAYGGDYDEDLHIVADRQWVIGALGTVAFSALNDFIYIGAASTNLIVTPMANGVTITLGRVGVGNPAATNWYFFFRGVIAASINASGTTNVGIIANMEETNVTANFNVPNLILNYSNGCTLGTGASDVTVRSINRCTETEFSDDITVTNAVTGGGFYDCTFTGTPLFTGPAGSARFDPVTARRFVTAGGTFGSAASKADFLPITTSAMVIDNGAGTGALTTRAINTAASSDLSITSTAAMSVSATTTLDLGAGGAATLTAGAGADVTITGGSSAGVVLAGGAGSTYDAKADVIAERTAAHGVIVDQVLVIDTSVKATRLFATGTDDVVVDTAGITLTLDQSVPAIIASSVIYAPNHQYLYIPLAVRPNASWDLLSAPFSDCSGTVLGVEFIAAVAATSAGGDITLALKDGSDDGDIAAATSIDGQTSVSLTVGSPGFSAGFYAQVTSDNPDAVQGAGLMALITFVVSGPSA